MDLIPQFRRGAVLGQEYVYFQKHIFYRDCTLRSGEGGVVEVMGVRGTEKKKKETREKKRGTPPQNVGEQRLFDLLPNHRS